MKKIPSSMKKKINKSVIFGGGRKKKNQQPEVSPCWHDWKALYQHREVLFLTLCFINTLFVFTTRTVVRAPHLQRSLSRGSWGLGRDASWKPCLYHEEGESLSQNTSISPHVPPRMGGLCTWAQKKAFPTAQVLQCHILKLEANP